MHTMDTPVTLLQEYEALTQACGLIDRSERGKLSLAGPSAVEFLNGQVTNEIAGLRGGEGCYAAFLTHKGKMLGDLRILAVAAQGTGVPSELLLDTERVALQALFDMINRFKLGHDLELGKRTLQSALLSLVGPAADEVAARATGAGAPAPGAGPRADEPVPTLGGTEHAHLMASISGRAVRLIRTAEPSGVDVLCDAADVEVVRAALVGAGAQPVSEAAIEIVRVEHGRPRYGVDLDDTVIPQEAGLNERAVSFTKGCYVGQETVARLHYKGRPNRHLRGLLLSRLLAGGEELCLDGRAVGRVSSVVLSPAHGPIALALVRREVQPGAVVSAGEDGATAEVTALPFASALDAAAATAGESAGRTA
jgi:tRNA-modifying protein YgfZ